MVADAFLRTQVVDRSSLSQNNLPMPPESSPPGPIESKPHFRALARRPVHLAATLIAGGGAWQRPARVIDLGLGGACLLLTEVVPVGSPVALVMDAPHLWDPLEIDGSVAWVGEQPGADAFCLGLRFAPRSGALLRTLTELLEAAAFG